jgi:hypothetical protein
MLDGGDKEFADPDEDLDYSIEVPSQSRAELAKIHPGSNRGITQTGCERCARAPKARTPN